MSKKHIFEFQSTFEGTYLPERLGYLRDRKSKKMLGLFFTDKGLEITTKFLNTCKSKFKFRKSYMNNGYIVESIGRLKLGDGSIVRIFFTPEGLKMVVPKKSKNILYYKETKNSNFGFMPNKEKSNVKQ